MGNGEKDSVKLKEALLKMATGYEYEEKIIEADKDGKNKKIKLLKKYMPPDMKALEKVMLMIKTNKW